MANPPITEQAAPVTQKVADDIFTPPAELLEAWTRHPDIVKLGDPVLRQVAKPVTQIKGETRTLIEKMMKTMKAARGLGLAAPQVGASLRILIYDAGDGVKALINPVILASKGEQVEPLEGCLSIPGLQGQVQRFAEIRVKGYDQRGKPVTRNAKELEARVIQHEMDHLDGILFFERADPETLEWVLSQDDGEDEL
jgi:peptide deformylase